MEYTKEFARVLDHAKIAFDLNLTFRVDSSGDDEKKARKRFATIAVFRRSLRASAPQ